VTGKRPEDKRSVVVVVVVVEVEVVRRPGRRSAREQSTHTVGGAKHRWQGPNGENWERATSRCASAASNKQLE